MSKKVKIICIFIVCISAIFGIVTVSNARSSSVSATTPTVTVRTGYNCPCECKWDSLMGN
ncbi:MAG: hypothetical protein FWC79_08190 [Oscillospiraceae bacterium]|nr:hypothetical protein [Oscillospiraceae bacterium]